MWGPENGRSNERPPVSAQGRALDVYKAEAVLNAFAKTS